MLLSTAGLAWDHTTCYYYGEPRAKRIPFFARTETRTARRRGRPGCRNTSARAPGGPGRRSTAGDGCARRDAKLLPGFKVERVKTSGAELHAVIGGSGPPLLLIHGAPLTHLSWFRVAPELAKKYTVVAADLRGYGDSSKPEDGDKHINYSKRAMAQDQIELMKHFGFDRFAVVGHDRGGRVAHRLALDHPAGRHRAWQCSTSCPRTTCIRMSPRPSWMRTSTGSSTSARRPTPRRSSTGKCRRATSAAADCRNCAMNTLRVYRDPANVHGMCEDYRASAGIDMEFDEADLKPTGRSPAPCMCCGPSDGAMGRMYDVLGIWKERGTKVTGAAMPGGHNLQETHPQETLAQLLPFLA